MSSDAQAATHSSGTKFSFLASHGLRSPLSAIRWACGRLRKSSTGKLNAEQQGLVEEIHANAKILTMVLGSMQLLGKLDDRSYKIKREQLPLSNFLTSLTHGMEHPRSVQWTLTCPPTLNVVSDGPVLESILLNLIMVCLEAGIDMKRVTIEALEEGSTITVSLISSLELPFVHSDPQADTGEVSHLVGGIPGLLFCLSSGMARHVGGKVELREMTDGDESGDGKMYRIRLVLPVASV